MAALITASCQSTQQQLESFNRSQPWDGVSANEGDSALLAHFRGYSFTCRKAEDFTAQENPRAADAFDAFRDYVQTGNRIDHFWEDPAHPQTRRQLLSAAVDAGSWRAKYLQAMWSIRMQEDEQSVREAGEQLQALTREGIPLAAYRYATLLPGRDDQTMYQLLIAAIERGSPDAMTLVAESIIARSKELRPLAKPMLDCALAQSHTEAYEGLGKLADMEGRGVDAYRLWEEGANHGCQECVGHLENLARAQPGYTYASQLEQTMPGLARLKRYYAGNADYELTSLPDFQPRPPPALAYHIDDKDLLAWFLLQQQMQSVYQGP